MKFAAILFIFLGILSTLALALPLGLPANPFALHSSKRALEIDHGEAILSRRSPGGVVAWGKERLATSRLALQARKKEMKRMREKLKPFNESNRDEHARVYKNYREGKAGVRDVAKSSVNVVKGRIGNAWTAYHGGRLDSDEVLAKAKAKKEERRWKERYGV
jgi:hypothetical protein